jgi:hypothetical protein
MPKDRYSSGCGVRPENKKGGTNEVFERPSYLLPALKKCKRGSYAQKSAYIHTIGTAKIPGNGLSGFISPSNRIQQNPIRGATRVEINILLCVVPKIDAISPAREQASTAADV